MKVKSVAHKINVPQLNARFNNDPLGKLLMRYKDLRDELAENDECMYASENIVEILKDVVRLKREENELREGEKIIRELEQTVLSAPEYFPRVFPEYENNRTYLAHEATLGGK